MAMATAFSSAVAVPNLGTTWQQGQPLKVHQAAPSSGAFCKRSPAVLAVRAQRGAEDETTRSGLMSTAMALAGAAMVAFSVTGSAEAAIQKVEGREREEQEAVTTGIKEPSRLSAAKGNTVQESARQNTQASGGLILGAPKLDEPAGAYRSPQSSTFGVDEVGSKRSSPAGILQGKSAGKSGSEGAQAD